MVFNKAESGYAKDCWIVEESDGAEEALVMTICKSSTDEYLNGDCTIVNRTKKDDETYEFKTVYRTSKIKAQDMDLNYPCLVSNIGLSRLMIQSLTSPSEVNTFNLEAEKMEFICFADYRKLEDIGFKDNRDAAQAELVPYDECGDKIAFVTRCFKEEEEEEDETEVKWSVPKDGEMFLNVLSIDSYSTPMRFELYTTNYEAAMEEGVADDSIQKCVAMQMTSQRGLDVTFIA